MDEEEIKKLRYSFSNPKEDMMLPTQNQFGHTILGPSGEKKDLSNFELIAIDELYKKDASLRSSAERILSTRVIFSFL